MDFINNKQSFNSFSDNSNLSSAYEYLCHIEEAKIWMETILKEKLPPALALKENLQNGVYLAKLGHYIAPETVPLSAIYDIFQHRYDNVGIQFRHSENIYIWNKALKAIHFPEIFIVEPDFLYEEDIPKVIYCIHALSIYLFYLGQAPLIGDVFGKSNFSLSDIEAISCDIEKKKIAIPCFQKIGGILSEQCMPKCDRRSVNEEIIKINNAIDKESAEELQKCLESPVLRIAQIIPKHMKDYLTEFSNVKREKTFCAQNKSSLKRYASNICDKLLNYCEIQGIVKKVNFDSILQDLWIATESKNRDNLRDVMKCSFVDIKDFKKENMEYYIDEAFEYNLGDIGNYCSKNTIQSIIRSGNRRAKEFIRVLDAVGNVKQALLSRDKEKLLTALRTPSLKLGQQVNNFAGSLYLEELEEDLKMAEELTYEDIKSSVFVLNFISEISLAVDRHDFSSIWKLLCNPDIPFMNLDPALKTQYFERLLNCRQQKLKQNLNNCLLTYSDIQNCIDSANVDNSQQMQALIYLEEINRSIRRSDMEALLTALNGLIPNEIFHEDAKLYFRILKKVLYQKQKNSDEELWLDDIKFALNQIQIIKKSASGHLSENNLKSPSKKTPDKGHKGPVSKLESTILKSIENDENYINHFLGNCPRGQVTNELRSSNILEKKKINNEITVYLNSRKKKFLPTKPTTIVDCKPNITSDLQGYRENSNLLISNDSLSISITKLQAIIRGYLLRKKVKKILAAVVVIQRWWRSNRREEFDRQKNKETKAVTLYDMKYYEKNVAKIVKIQALWRGNRCRLNASKMNFGRMGSSNDKSFQFLLRLALSGQINNQDYTTDLKVQAMKSCVVETIKINQDLAKKLENMDMKIGLLVQNRMSVEAMIAENKKLQNSAARGSDIKGIKAFSKEARRLLNGYRKLFYLLQTDPVYFTRLIVRLPSKLNHVIQNCVLSLFNYGSTSRDSYLLLRLFRCALVEEVHHKFHKPVDALTGNPLVLRLAVAFARQAEGHNPLRNILGFLIEKVLNDKVFIDTNPVDIYCRWINQMETESGRPSNLPQIVTQDEALCYPEVVDRLNHNLRILKSWVKCFIDRLSHCVNQFPYALRFIGKLLRTALLDKFPQTPEKDILKIVGNLIYYQYINSAIVAPDAFYMVSLPAHQSMRVEQRRNLASIAKILHFAATKKGFGEESKYLMCLNPFIIDCHKEMKKFCENCCTVEDLEDHYHVTKYSEVSQIDKPRIYITLEEIRECHRLLLDVRSEVAPDPTDPIHEILDDLGPPPTLAILIGCEDSSESTLCRTAKMQVCLELDNYTLQNRTENSSVGERLFIETKKLIISRLTELKGKSLVAAIRNSSHADIAANLQKLELAGFVKKDDDYQDILKSIIKDFSDRREYRRLRNREMNVLKTAQHRLCEKRKFHEDQLIYYEQYLRTCLSNLKASSDKGKEKKERRVKYSGTRLHEKGVLISLDGVPPGQLRNVQFEISTTEFNGIYAVRGRFMGIEVEKINLDIQELLKLQFEGRREINIFGKAQINVNLLLHLLNKKFHVRP